jgi:hypothetical protein
MDVAVKKAWACMKQPVGYPNSPQHPHYNSRILNGAVGQIGYYRDRAYQNQAVSIASPL